MVPILDAAAIARRDGKALAALRRAVAEDGFLVVENTAISKARVLEVIAAYRAFFHLPEAAKAAVDMAKTGSNRGWGASGSEQVDPEANPDYKQVFDCGFELPAGDPLRAEELSVYADNRWPQVPAFRETVQAYYTDALGVACRFCKGLPRRLASRKAILMRLFQNPWRCCAVTFIRSVPSGRRTRISESRPTRIMAA